MVCHVQAESVKLQDQIQIAIPEAETRMVCEYQSENCHLDNMQLDKVLRPMRVKDIPPPKPHPLTYWWQLHSVLLFDQSSDKPT